MLHRFAVLTAVLTFPLIFVGATVTTKDAALAVPDWPLSYGSFFPRMVGNIVYEHGHRLLAALVGLLTLVLAVWVQRAEDRRWVRALGWTALGAVVAQGILGGLTVLNLRSPVLSALHGCLAQAFFASVAMLALVTSRSFREARAGGGSFEDRARSLGAPGVAAAALTVAVLLQLGLGAAVRHLEATTSIPDFPLAFGGLAPPAEKLRDPAVAVHFAHRLGGLLVVLLTIAAAWAALRSRAQGLRTPAVVLLVLVPFQVLLGGITVWTEQGYVPATLHVAVGALILVTCTTLLVQALRLGGGAHRIGPEKLEKPEQPERAEETGQLGEPGRAGEPGRLDRAARAGAPA